MISNATRSLSVTDHLRESILSGGLPAGTKLLVVNPAVRRGMLLLQKENVVLLGGLVRRRGGGRPRKGQALDASLN